MLVGCSEPVAAHRRVLLGQVQKAVWGSIRETDVLGWHEEGATLGVIFTETGEADTKEAVAQLISRMTKVVEAPFDAEQLRWLQVAFYTFPEQWGDTGSDGPARAALYESSLPERRPSGSSLFLKRAIDVVGSACALVVLSPLMLAIAVGIKLTSKGPVLFRQHRVGQYGQRFEFLKFRSMTPSSDSSVHEKYMEEFIAGKAQSANGDGGGEPLYKLKNDSRVTGIGKILRRTSLDELPQFINVLKGEMSLVGPRPPIPYEVDKYDLWHRRRLLEVKPGITGLWQVSGRSKVGFDEMVRLDLQYAKTWSIGQDLKILAKTPGAVIGGDGAY
jgi:lipopolysaccharide/colanic/teichoic acid biosynthesis glycosyltransferase